MVQPKSKYSTITYLISNISSFSVLFVFLYFIYCLLLNSYYYGSFGIQFYFFSSPTDIYNASLQFNVLTKTLPVYTVIYLYFKYNNFLFKKMTLDRLSNREFVLMILLKVVIFLTCAFFFVKVLLMPFHLASIQVKLIKSGVTSRYLVTMSDGKELDCASLIGASSDFQYYYNTNDLSILFINKNSITSVKRYIYSPYTYYYPHNPSFIFNLVMPSRDEYLKNNSDWIKFLHNTCLSNVNEDMFYGLINSFD